jgi:hypothetical protein
MEGAMSTRALGPFRAALRVLAPVPLLAALLSTAGMGAEGDAEAPAAPPGFVRQALLDAPGVEARFTLSMEDPGYVMVSFGPEAANAGLEAEIFNPLGDSVGKNTAFNFIPGTVEIVVRDPRGRFAQAEPVPVHVEIRPEADFLEPNTEAHPAAIRLNAWYANVLAPADEDHFLIDVPESGFLRVEHQNRENRFNIHWRAAGGDRWMGGDLYEAAEGRHILKFTDASRTPELEPFRFRVTWTPPQSEEPRELALGEAVPALIARPGFVERFTLNLPQAGLLELSVMGDAPEYTVLQIRKGEEQMRGAPLRQNVAAGVYDVEVYSERRHVSPRPFHVLANLYKTTDTNEPNDSQSGAAAAALDKPVRVVLYPETDTDWFRFDIPEAGFLTLLVETSEQNRSRAASTLRVWEPAPKEADGANADTTASPAAPVEKHVPRHMNRRTARLGPFEVSPGPLWLRSTGNIRDIGHMEFVVTPEFRPASKAAEGDQVFVIGLSLNDRTRNEMAALMGASGGVYVDAENTEVLKTRMEEVKLQAEKEARRRTRARAGSGWIWLLVILAAAGGAGWYCRERLKDMAHTYAHLLRPKVTELLNRVR